jgi:hypothetical protein
MEILVEDLVNYLGEGIILDMKRKSLILIKDGQCRLYPKHSFEKMMKKLEIGDTQ